MWAAPVVFNNVLYGCSAGGISVQNGCEALIFNNTLVNCPNAIKMFDHLDRIAPPYCLTAASGKATLANNIIWNSTPAFNLAGNALRHPLRPRLLLRHPGRHQQRQPGHEGRSRGRPGQFQPRSSLCAVPPPRTSI